jgi:hypothetical protein
MADLGFVFRQRQEIFLFSKSSRSALVHNQSPVKVVPKLKHPGRDVDNPLPSSAED